MPTPRELVVPTAVYDQTWTRAVRPGTNVVHIMPMRDLRPHRAGIDCECRPQRVLPPFGETRHIVLLHNAWDVRELLSADGRVDVEDAIVDTFDEADDIDHADDEDED